MNVQSQNRDEPCVPLKEFIEARLNAMEKAVIIATTDMERRLDELNQLRKDVITDRSQFLSLEVFNATLKEWSMWRETTVNRITIMETRAVTWTAALGIFFIVLQLFLYWFIHK